jgi:hypothetical protein
MMLTIRDEQMAAFQEAMLRRFVPSVAQYLRDRLPERVADLDGAQMKQRVKEIFGRARKHAIVIEWDLCRYAFLDMILGPNFEARCTWAAPIFSRRDLDATQKVAAALEYYLNYLDDSRHA